MSLRMTQSLEMNGNRPTNTESNPILPFHFNLFLSK